MLERNGMEQSNYLLWWRDWVKVSRILLLLLASWGLLLSGCGHLASRTEEKKKTEVKSVEAVRERNVKMKTGLSREQARRLDEAFAFIEQENRRLDPFLMVPDVELEQLMLRYLKGKQRIDLLRAHERALKGDGSHIRKALWEVRLLAFEQRIQELKSLKERAAYTQMLLEKFFAYNTLIELKGDTFLSDALMRSQVYNGTGVKVRVIKYRLRIYSSYLPDGRLVKEQVYRFRKGLNPFQTYTFTRSLYQLLPWKFKVSKISERDSLRVEIKIIDFKTESGDWFVSNFKKEDEADLKYSVQGKVRSAKRLNEEK